MPLAVCGKSPDVRNHGSHLIGMSSPETYLDRAYRFSTAATVEWVMPRAGTKLAGPCRAARLPRKTIDPPRRGSKERSQRSRLASRAFFPASHLRNEDLFEVEETLPTRLGEGGEVHRIAAAG